MSKQVRSLSDYTNAVADPTLDRYAAYRLVGCKDVTQVIYDLKKVLKIRLGSEAYKFRHFWLITSIGVVISFSGDTKVMEIIANRLCDRSSHFTRAEELHAGGGPVRFKAFMQGIEMMFTRVPFTRSYSGSSFQAKAKPRKAPVTSASPND